MPPGGGKHPQQKQQHSTAVATAPASSGGSLHHRSSATTSATSSGVVRPPPSAARRSSSSASSSLFRRLMPLWIGVLALVALQGLFYVDKYYIRPGSPPPVPLNTVTVIGRASNQILVGWRAAVDLSNLTEEQRRELHVTEWRISCRTMGAGTGSPPIVVSVPVASQRVLISNLQPSSTLECSHQAVNDFGASPPSPTVRVSVPEKESLPLLLPPMPATRGGGQPSQPGMQRLAVSWHAPELHGREWIDTYIVTVRQLSTDEYVGSAKVETKDPMQEEFSVTVEVPAGIPVSDLQIRLACINQSLHELARSMLHDEAVRRYYIAGIATAIQSSLESMNFLKSEIGPYGVMANGLEFVWTPHASVLEFLPRTFRHPWVNHICNVQRLTDRVELHLSLLASATDRKSVSAFMPRTWLAQRQSPSSWYGLNKFLADAAASGSSTQYLVRNGAGKVLAAAARPEDVSTMLNKRTQAEERYSITAVPNNRHLINGRRYILRRFVMVTSLQPFVAFLARVMMVRFPASDTSATDGEYWAPEKFVGALDMQVAILNTVEQKMQDAIVAVVKAWPTDAHFQRRYEYLAMDFVLSNEGVVTLMDVHEASVLMTDTNDGFARKIYAQLLRDGSGLLINQYEKSFEPAACAFSAAQPGVSDPDAGHYTDIGAWTAAVCMQSGPVPTSTALPCNGRAAEQRANTLLSLPESQLPLWG